MCPAELPTLLVLLLIAASSARYGCAQQAVVETPAQLRAALSDAAVGTIVLPKQVSLDPGVFAPVTVARAVVVASDGAYGCLDFGNTSSALISVGPGGNMTLQGLTIRSFYPAQPLQVTPASSIMPIAAVGVSSNSAELHVESCVFHVQGQLRTVTGPMPFWSAQLPDILQAAPTAVSSNQQQVAPISAQMSYFGGDSSVTVSKSVLAIDPSGCYTGQGRITWDSSSLWAALQKPAVTHAVVFVNISLSAQQFSPLVNSPISNMTISGCSGTWLDFNQLHGALVMQQGATLQLTGPLQLLGTAAPSAASNSSNSSSLLLLDSIDISSGAPLVLQDVAVGVPDSSSVLQAMQQSLQDSNSAAAAVIQQLPAAGGQQSPLFVVQQWNVDFSGVVLPDAGPAAAGTCLTMRNVTVFQAAQSCFPAGSKVAVAADDGKLQAFLMDSDIMAIQIVRDITLRGGDWQAQSPDDILDISRPVEIRGCHPNSTSGGHFTVDFSELQGTPLINLNSMLRISGDLVLKGLPDREGSPGSWMLVPIVSLAGDQAALVFEDVLLTGRTPSPMHPANGAAWQAAGGMAAAAHSWGSLNSSMSMMQQVKVPLTTAAKLFPSMFGSSSNSSSTSRRLMQTSATPSSSSNSGGDSYYGYIDSQLDWDPSLAAKAQRSVEVAPLVLGLLLGLVLVAAVLAGSLLLVRRRRRRMQQYQHDGSKHGADVEHGRARHPRGACCWKPAGRKDSHWQILAANGTAGQNGSAYAAADSLNAGWGGGDGPRNGHDIAILTSISNHDASGVIGPVGSAENSRHGPSVYPPRPSLAQQNHFSGLFAGDHSPQLSAQPSPHYRELADANHLGQYESRASGGFDLVDRFNSSRAVHPVTTTGGGFTTDGHTTVTDEGTGGGGGVGVTGGQQKQHKQQVFEDARRRLGAAGGDLARSDALVLESVLGEGTFGKVFKGYWKGTLVAVKTMMFPAAMSGKEKREKMAIMETAISASLSHPNIVQMYTYYLRPVLVGHEATLTGPSNAEGDRLDRSSVGDSTMNAAFLNEGLSDSVHSWEVQLVLEYCDQGSLRSLLNKKGSFTQPDGTKDMVLVVDTALDVARAMLHLHSENIIHSDLKARNILLKSSGGADGRPFVAKVADFGLSMRIDPNATHVSNVYQGTMTHMAPEVMLQGKLSRGSDVYAFGVLLWELYSGGHAFKGVPRALLGHEVAHKQRRPEFPDGSPFEYQLLACRCWESDVSIRPSFHEILLELQRMKERMAAAAASSSITLASSDRTSNVTLASNSRATSQQQRQPAADQQGPAIALQQQQQHSSNSGRLSPASQHMGGAAATDAGSQADREDAAAGAVAGDWQGQATEQQQQQQGKQQPTGHVSVTEPLRKREAAAADESVIHTDGQAAPGQVGMADLQQADAAAVEATVQQQQNAEQRFSKDNVPENLLRQLSMSLGDSIGSPRPPHPAAAAAKSAGVTADLGASAANSTGSPPCNQHQQYTDSSMHRQASVSGVGKSVYISDPFGSTTDEFHPRWVLYGAGAHLRQRGIFWPDTDTSSEADGSGAADQSPPEAPAAAVVAADGVAGSRFDEVQVPAVDGADNATVGQAASAAAVAAAGASSPGIRDVVSFDEERLQQQQQAEAAVQQQQSTCHVQLSQQQQQQEHHWSRSGIKRITSATVAAARKLLRSSSSTNRHTAPSAAAATPVDTGQSVMAVQADPAAAATVHQQQQVSVPQTVEKASAVAVAAAAVPGAAVLVSPHDSAPQQQQPQRRSSSLDAGSSTRSSTSSRRSTEISTSSSKRSIELAGRSSTDSKQQHNQQMLQLIPVMPEHLQQIEEGSSGEQPVSLQKMPSVVAHLQQRLQQERLVHDQQPYGQLQHQVQQPQQQDHQLQALEQQPRVVAQLQQRPQQQQQPVQAQQQQPHVVMQLQQRLQEQQQQPVQQQQPRVVAQLQHQPQQQQQVAAQEQQPYVVAQLQQQLQQQHVRFQVQDDGGPIQQQQHQQQQPVMQRRSLSEASLSDTDDKSSSISHSSSGTAPTSDSSTSRSGLAHSGSAAALAAVMSLKAALAKRAMAERTATSSPAGANGGAARIAAPVAMASAVAPVQSSRSGPLLRPPGFSAVGQAADAARLLQQQHPLSVPLPVLGAPAAAAGGGVLPYSSFTARRSLQAGQTSNAPATPFALGAPIAQPTTAAAAGRYSLDSRAKSVSVAALSREHHRPAPRAVASARGGFSGVTSPVGTTAAAAAAGDSAVSSTSVSPAPAKPRFSFHRAVRKALSARDLAIGSQSAAAAAAAVPAAGAMMTSDPFAATSLDGDVSLAQHQHHQQQHQLRDPLQQQLQQVQWLEQAASAGSNNSQDPALAALAPDQLQLLAQIADAAKAQVSFELPLPQPPRTATSGPLGSFSNQGVSAPLQQPSMSHALPSLTSQYSTAVAGPSAAAAAGLTGQFAGVLGGSISDLCPHHVPTHQLPPPRHWGGYLGPPAAGTSHRTAATAGRFSLEQRACGAGPQAAAAGTAATVGGRRSLDIRKGQFGGAGGGPAVASPSGNVLRYATQQRPVGEQAEPPRANHFGQGLPMQEAAGLTGQGLQYSTGHSPGRSTPTGGFGAKARRASAPPQHPLAIQRERWSSALHSIADHDSGAQSNYGAGFAARRSRRASAPTQPV